MASGRVELDVENVTRVPVRRFAFFMKAIADNDLWDEVEFHLEDLGCTEVMVSSEPIAAIQELLSSKVAAGEQLSSRTKRVAECACFGPGTGPGGPGGGHGPNPA